MRLRGALDLKGVVFMILYFALIIIGFVLLIKGADFLIEGSSSVAKKIGISEIVIGLTVVSIGTSAPEMVVNIFAAITDNSEIAIGNVLGSNIANTLLVLGICGLIAPLVIKENTVKMEIPFCILASILLGILLNNSIFNQTAPSGLSGTDGLILIMLFIVFLIYAYFISKKDLQLDDDFPEYPLPRTFIYILAGIAGLALGGRMVVSGAVSISRLLGISEAFVGLSIVALGTSLPELFASGVAVYKGRKDIAIGNVVGSNIFNILLVLGVSSIISPINYSPVLNFDLMFVILSIIFLYLFMYLGKKYILTKFQAILFLIAYVSYIGIIAYRG